jgi:hypothetical protein
LYESTVVSMPLSESSTLSFSALAGQPSTIESGALQSLHRLEFSHGDKNLRVDSLQARLRRTGADLRHGFDLDIRDEQGNLWFSTDHGHHTFSNDKNTLEIKNMDLRASPYLANHLGLAALSGLSIGAMNFQAKVTGRASTRLPQACENGDYNWHGKLLDPANPALGTYQTDVLLLDTTALAYKRCAGTCDGPGGLNTGRIVVAPDAYLANSNTNTSADAPWYTKFSGNFAPHNNDQHPFLVWNTYRINNLTNSIENIGRSGVKHAFFTINDNCAEYNCGNGNILYRKCEDVYSSGNNDSTTDLGPRSEIIPSRGLWARCDSVYDTNCDGQRDVLNATDTSFRMLIDEAKFENPSNYTYFYESWYVIRDDVNIYNTMGSREFQPVFNQLWSTTTESVYRRGPVIDLWVSPNSTNPNELNAELVTPDGRMKLAVKVRALLNGRYRYDYALMNFDLISANTAFVGTGSSNLRQSNRAAVNRFRIPQLDSGLTNITSNTGESVLQNWTASTQNGVLFTSPGVAHDLEWNSLYTFSFESDKPPVRLNAEVQLRGSTSSYQVQTLAPQSSNIFANGFE